MREEKSCQTLEVIGYCAPDKDGNKGYIFTG